ncbi:TPA: hypothetical protein ACYHFQ_002886, partial [Staphylococcus aureus]
LASVRRLVYGFHAHLTPILQTLEQRSLIDPVHAQAGSNAGLPTIGLFYRSEEVVVERLASCDTSNVVISQVFLNAKLRRTWPPNALPLTRHLHSR